jgi:hypothetical protein
MCIVVFLRKSSINKSYKHVKNIQISIIKHKEQKQPSLPFFFFFTLSFTICDTCLFLFSACVLFHRFFDLLQLPSFFLFLWWLASHSNHKRTTINGQITGSRITNKCLRRWTMFTYRTTELLR